MDMERDMNVLFQDLVGYVCELSDQYLTQNYRM